jgi:hypothetical protein
MVLDVAGGRDRVSTRVRRSHRQNAEQCRVGGPVVPLRSLGHGVVLDANDVGTDGHGRAKALICCLTARLLTPATLSA